MNSSTATNSAEPKPREMLLRLEHVFKTYHTGEVDVPVLKDVNLEIYDGEILAVVGPSGSGKSTLLNLLGGIDVPTSGEIWFDGEEISRFTEAQLTRYRRQSVGFVFQFFNLVPTLTARENVLVSEELGKNTRDADETLGLVGLAARKDHFPSQLSGGEQQRVAIARAVAKNPQILLCDEPTGSLDLTTGRSVLEVLSRLNAELGTTVLIITHNMAISAMAHRTVRLGSGSVTETSVNKQPTPAGELSW